MIDKTANLINTIYQKIINLILPIDDFTLDNVNKWTISNNYLKNYEVSMPNETTYDYLNLIDKEKIIFAYFHSKLDYLFEFINFCLNKPDKHVNASQSRELIDLINQIKDFLDNTKNVILDESYAKTLDSFIKSKWLSSTGGSNLPKYFNRINLLKYQPIFLLKDLNITADIKINELIRKISTNDNDWFSKNNDAKLEDLANAIEFLLKNDKDYDPINSSDFFELIDDKVITKYHKILHAFRHGSKIMLESRKKFSDKQKQFLINFGITILNNLV